VSAPDGWGDFFVATAGAAGALAGLIIVAMSVNIKQILEIPSMTSRAAATIGSLVLIVVSAGAGLVPGQGPRLLGGEVLLFSLVALWLTIDASVRMLRAAPAEWRRSTWAKVALALAQVAPFVVGAVVLLAGGYAGLYWIAAGVILVFAGAVGNAWVLLVEILR
jgi:hypothetical protein